MPHVSNLSATAYSIWGRRLVDGMAEGREEWIDELAPGGAGEFPEHGEITVRTGTSDPKGARVLGPLDTTHVVIDGATTSRTTTALWVGGALLALVLLALLVVFVLLMVTPR